LPFTDPQYTIRLMQCRSCGIEIADKAIVCYRCGAATTDPVRKPAALRPGRRPLVPLVAVALLVVMAVSLGQLSRTAADPDQLQLLAGLCAGGAIAVLLLTLLRRR
jgi:hypothetical protein